MLTKAGAVADLELHMKYSHTDQREDKSTFCEETEEYKRATQLVDIPVTQDDCYLNLSPVRVVRAPLSWKNSQLQLPVCTYGDYKAYGIKVNNR